MNGNAVRVVLWGDTVGYLTWDSSNWRTTTAVFSFANASPSETIDSYGVFILSYILLIYL